MHPQMQNVFSQYLFAYYSKESAMQGFVTTHSHEVVRNSRISQLRVLRQVRPFECCLYDLHKFIDEEMIKAKLHTVFDRFKDDPYFQFIYGADYESYFSKPGVTKARDCLKGNTAYSILSAYKLFYVGCSRARRNLTILLDSSKIKGNLEPQKKRFEEIGFQVVSSPIH